MKEINATEIKRFDNWTVLIYSEPGKGKTSMVKTLEGNTVVFSVDGMYHVLSQLPNIKILAMDPKKPSEDLGDFYRYLLKNLKHIDNIVIDNISTFQKYWLNDRAKSTTSGMPEIKDYPVYDRVILDFTSSLKTLKKNLVLFAHEKSVEVTKTSGAVYTQFQPDTRNMDAIMGIVPLVGRLVIRKNEETQEKERIIILQPSQTTKAKDQLIGNLETIGQMELFKTLKGEK